MPQSKLRRNAAFTLGQPRAAMVSVIIPTWNEAVELPSTLRALGANTEPHETIVVDAGSSDATLAVAKGAGARVFTSSQRRRATQMNLGARQALGETLLFLHADTRLRSDSLREVQRALREPGVVGGAFARRFDHPSRLLHAGCIVGDQRARLLGWFFGDQAIFARRDTFERVGGFREWSAFEDIDFSRRLRDVGRTVLLTPPIWSSGRRFAGANPLWRMLGDFWMFCGYAVGAGENRR